MHYYLANLSLIDGNSGIEFVEEMPVSEVTEFFNEYKFMRVYKQAKKLSEYAVSNGIALQTYIKKVSEGLYSNETNREKIVDKANRMTYEYCASIGTLVDIYKEYLGEISFKRKDKFQKFLNKLYHGEKFEYRFFIKLRNYCIHYEFPYNIYQEDINNIKMSCSKEHLLKYNGWDKVVEDFKTIGDDNIDITIYISQMNIMIYELYLQFLYEIKDKLTGILNKAEDIYNKYHPKRLFAIITISDELNDQIENRTFELSLDNKKMSITYIDVDLIKESITELGQHPSVNLI